jgi:hypothetical protein
MSKLTSKKVLAATVAGLAVAGGGAAIAASQTESPASSFLDSVAKHLGISSAELEDATRAAAIDQVDQALEEGRITQEQADELKSRIESGDFPGFLGPGLVGPGLFGLGHAERAGPGHHMFLGGKLASAAEYLGLTQAELREQLAGGKSLAEIAEAEGKSVDGLKQAMLAGAKSDLDDAVKNERLTQAQADEIYEQLQSSIDDLVDGTLPGPRFRHGFGRGFGGPPKSDPDDDGGSGGSALEWDTAA